MTRKRIILLPLFALAGCATSTPVSVLSTPQTIIDTRDVVLKCTVTSAANRWNFNFAENYLGPMPSHIEGGGVTDVTFRVDEVVKGQFKEPTLRIKDAQTPGEREHKDVGAIDPKDFIHVGERLTLGFNRSLFGKSEYSIAR